MRNFFKIIIIIIIKKFELFRSYSINYNPINIIYS
jgi:hypothetical protein